MLFLQDGSRRVPLLALVAITALSAAVLAGALPGGDSSESTAEAAIAQTIKATFSDDPASCALATENFLSSHFQPDDGQTALEACREAAREHSSPGQESVSIGSIEVAGSAASASFTVTGGSYGSAQMTIRLVDQTGWKIDSITAVELDKARWLQAQREGIDRSSPQEAALESCVFDWVDRNVPVEEINTAMAGGSHEFLLGSVRACVAPARDAFIAGIRSAMAENGATAAQIDCVAYQVRAVLTDADLRAFFTAILEERTPSPEIGQKAQQAAAGCGPVAPGGPPTV